MMQEDAIFINTARGAIIREEEMAEVLAARPKMRAVLDVFCKEPMTPDNPLRTLPNVYCIPHRGGPTIDRRPVIAENLFKEAYAYVNDPTSPLQDEVTREKAAPMTNR